MHLQLTTEIAALCTYIQFTTEIAALRAHRAQLRSLTARVPQVVALPILKVVELGHKPRPLNGADMPKPAIIPHTTKMVPLLMCHPIPPHCVPPQCRASPPHAWSG